MLYALMSLDLQCCAKRFSADNIYISQEYEIRYSNNKQKMKFI